MKAEPSVHKALINAKVAYVVATYTSPVMRPAGLGWDGTHYWLSDLDTDKIHKLLIAEGLMFADGFEHGDTSGWSFASP